MNSDEEGGASSWLQRPQRHGREKRARRLGVGSVMDFLAEDPTRGAGIGCPGLKRETGDWLLQ